MFCAFIIVLGVVMRTASAADPTFDPGCSFYGGQCVYSIKLGHKDQCDTPQTSTSVTSNGGCCDDLSTKYSELKDNMEKLSIKVNVMSTSIADSSKNASEVEKELQKALIARDDIVAVLTRKESELNSTKAELAKVMAQAAKEIETLRNNLNSFQNSLSNCQTALGGVDQTTSGKTPDSQLQHFNMNYYNFNQLPKDFTFSQTPSYHLKMELLHQGSSTNTGPKIEHSWVIHKGSYLGINSRVIADKTSSDRTTTVNAETGIFQPAYAYCIMFWYYMEGKNVKTLTINIKINGGTGYPIYTRTGPSMSHEWQLARIDLDNEYTQYPFQIDFVMNSDSHYTYFSGQHILKDTEGDIAVDDLYVYNTTCSNIPRHPSHSQYLYNNNVTSFYTFHFTPMTWTEAYDVCRREGPWSALVSLETNEEHRQLVNTIIRKNSAYNLVGNNGYWTSGTDADSEHTFVWTSTGVPKEITESYWHSGQPNNVAGNQNCLLLEYPNDDFRWGDVDCNTKHPFICEVEVPGKVN